MKIISSAGMNSLDKRTQEDYSIPEEILMENAGIRAWACWRNRFPGDWPRAGLVFIAGTGNNGGDSLVMARSALTEGAKNISIILFDRKGSRGFSIQRTICEKLGLPIICWKEKPEECKKIIGGAKAVFDGLLGTGISGPIKETILPLVEAINKSPAEIIALDLPSGLGDSFRKGYAAVKAGLTLTFGLPKLCLYLPAAREYCGEIINVNPGFPEELLENDSIPGNLLVWKEARQYLPKFTKDVYKNQRGHVGVFAGSIGTHGAAVLCSQSAARALSGLTTLVADPELYPAVSGRLSSVMVKITTEDPDLSRFSSLCVGPGWGINGRTGKLKYLISSGLPGVLDADGITVFAELKASPGFSGNWVLTPHMGEFARLTGLSTETILEDPISPLLQYSAKLKACIVLKGSVTYIGSPEGYYWVLDERNPCMATGGSGDVLSGIISGFIAAGAEPLKAALAGAALHSEIGKIAAKERGWFLAEDLVSYISGALRE